MEAVSPDTARRNTKAAEVAQAEAEKRLRKRKTTINCLSCSAGSDDSSEDKWANKGPIFLFVGLCLLIFVILCCVYGLRIGRGHHAKHQSLKDVYAVGDPVYAKDLWLIIELQSDHRGRRTHLGQATGAHVCAAIKAAQKIGWTPLLVGAKSRCCRSRCRNLHPRDLAKMKHASSAHLAESSEHGNLQMAMKTAAFLAAIKRGAHFIFHSNPEVYYWAGVSAEDFQRELEYQLQKTTLGISVGLVKQSGSNSSSSLYPGASSTTQLVNPYVHFGDEESKIQGTQDEDEASRFSYKICEIRPPSIEKFLDSNRLNLDASAPPVIYPGTDFKAPFDSRNTVFNRDAFWSLLLLPGSEESSSYVADHDEEVAHEEELYLLRAVVAQQILGEIGGATKFSVARQRADRERRGLEGLNSAKFERVLTFAKDWFCEKDTVLKCFKAFTSDLILEGLLPEKNGRVVDLWIQDLKAVGYQDIPLASDSSPCIGDNALEGVYFHPHAVEEKKQPDGTADSNGSGDVMSPRGGKSLPNHSQQLNNLADNEASALKQIKKLCPAVDTSELTIYEDLHEDILLIITFYRKEYQNIPLLEIMYRPHFKNILYCGEPDELVDRYMAEYSKTAGRHFSFLPTHSHTGYECILGSIEMGYHVNGFLLINQDTLINSWNFKDLNPDVIWHGNEHAQAITNDNIVEIDPPTGAKIMRSSDGILKSFEFLEQVLLGHTEHHHSHSHSHHHTHDHTGHSHPTVEPRSRRNGKSSRPVGEPTDLADSLESRIRNRRDSEDEFLESAEELEFLDEGSTSSDDHDPSKRGSDVMSITDDVETTPMLASHEWHINFFGELKHDTTGSNSSSSRVNFSNPTRAYFPTDSSDLTGLNGTNGTGEGSSEGMVHGKFRNVSEILFHPSNFDREAMMDNSNDKRTMESTEFEKMIYDIQKVYKKINSKLQLWLRFVSPQGRVQHSGSIGSHSVDEDGNEIGHDEMEEQLSELQCDQSANNEICQIVAHFFNTLEMNEADGQFKLYFDDLPIYYVPASHKDKLYLMANLLTKFHVADELAFPLLLRGLTTTDSWINLRRSEVPKKSERPPLTPQDLLLSDELDDIHAELDSLEAAHYLYPVNMTTEVLQNDLLKSVICRNF